MEANFAHYSRPPTAVDWAIASATPAREYSSDVDPFGTAAECRPSSPGFVLYYAIDVNADGDDDGADGGVMRWLMGPFWGCHVGGMFLY